MTAHLTPQRPDSLEKASSQFTTGKLVSFNKFQKLQGLMEAESVIVLLKARPIQHCFNSFHRHPKTDRRLRLFVAQSFIRAVLEEQGLCFRRKSTGNIAHRRSVITTDASQTTPTPPGHQNTCSHTEYSFSYPQGVFTIHTTQACASKNRQHLSSISHKPPGWDKVAPLSPGRKGTSDMGMASLASLRAIHIPSVMNRAAVILSRMGPKRYGLGSG